MLAACLVGACWTHSVAQLFNSAYRKQTEADNHTCVSHNFGHKLKRFKLIVRHLLRLCGSSTSRHGCGVCSQLAHAVALMLSPAATCFHDADKGLQSSPHNLWIEYITVSAGSQSSCGGVHAHIMTTCCDRACDSLGRHYCTLVALSTALEL